jgi:hypothetical protein
MNAADIRKAADAALAQHRKFGVGSAYHVSAESALEDALREMTGELRIVGVINGRATVESMTRAARAAWPAERGRGQGRKPVKVGEDTVTMSIRLTPAQREKLAQLGGAGWVRDRIDGATDPSAS